MKVLIIGSGIAGMSCAIEAASKGADVTLISPMPSERAQSVMAAGGINACIDPSRDGDSTESHLEDTYKGGVFIEDRSSLQKLTEGAPEHIHFLESLGVVFSRDSSDRISQRAFGGQSHKRTCYSGSSTGKQIVTGLIQKCREYEARANRRGLFGRVRRSDGERDRGSIQRILGPHFHSALIRNGRCYGALTMDGLTGELTEHYADAVVMATGGMNKLFGKTTGTEICDGYATAKLLMQGVRLRNLEFIQYHPTTIETASKRMLITEAARGEGGRLYYMKDGKRCYFMEKKFGERGNLMPRDVVSKCIYDCPSQVYLDIAFLGEELIHHRLEEVYELCQEYLGLDVTRESIPVAPSVHFFMGGIAVDDRHETNIRGLYAVGEAASKYHGANRLGGNSLLAAVHSGRVAGAVASENGMEVKEANRPDFQAEIQKAEVELEGLRNSKSKYPSVYMMKEIAEVMNRDLGITRDEQGLEEGVKQIDKEIEFLSKLHFDPNVSIYENYRMPYLAELAKAILLSARVRKESRGSHIRTDYPETNEQYRLCSFAEKKGDEIRIFLRSAEQ